MRFIGFIILLLLISCRCHKEFRTELTEVSSTEERIHHERDSSQLIVELLRSASSLELSGITINFYPPDSLHPHIRAIPSSISIDKANIAESSGQAAVNLSGVVSSRTENLQGSSSNEIHQQSSSESDTRSSFRWTLIISAILTVIGIVLFIRFFKIRF